MVKMAFLTANSFFLVRFKNTDQKDICASIVFKAESKPKHKEKKNWGVFFKNQKHAFLGLQNSSFKKFKFRICFSAFVLLSKRKLHADFHKKILIFRPPGIF